MRKCKKRLLRSLTVFVLIAAAALSLAGCGGTEKADKLEKKITYTFEVTGRDGETKSFEIITDLPYVGDALEEMELIQGEDGEFGLYVKTVAGETLDYDTDGLYWAFYVNGEYGTSGVDTTEAEAGAVYAFRAE